MFYGKDWQKAQSMGTVGLYAKDRILICAYFVWYIERQLVREMPGGLGMVPGVNESVITVENCHHRNGRC